MGWETWNYFLKKRVKILLDPTNDAQFSKL